MRVCYMTARRKVLDSWHRWTAIRHSVDSPWRLLDPVGTVSTVDGTSAGAPLILVHSVV